MLDLSTAQWALAENLIHVLRPFEVATTVLNRENKASLSSIMRIMIGISSTLTTGRVIQYLLLTLK